MHRSSSHTHYFTYTKLAICSSQPNQESNASVFLHHAGQIASTRIQESCRLLHVSKESQLCSPVLTGHLLNTLFLDNVRPSLRTRAFLTLTSACTLPISQLFILFDQIVPMPSSSLCVSRHAHQSSASGAGLLARNPGRRSLRLLGTFG